MFVNRACIAPVIFACSTSALFLHFTSTALAENIAPSVHWGAIAYPDLDRTLETGVTFNRFTEFNSRGQRFNDIRESAGFNFATITWTERIKALPGWNTNLTVGAGPTGPEPTRYLQNDFLHRLLEFDPVPVAASREGADYMIGGSLTKWGRLFGQRETGFAGIGFSSGSLYHEANAQVGFRRMSLAEVGQSWSGTAPSALNFVSKFIRFSGMGRYGRLYGGATYPKVAPHSYLGQVSVSLADYRGEEVDPPVWEVELALSIDSGLFVDRKGDSIEKQFGSIVIHFPYGVFEFWNDAIGRQDFGPTAGGRVMLDVWRIYEHFK
ncbi:MAG: hypothetical protein ACT4OO_13345 [Nitrospiraceae bacterium]